MISARRKRNVPASRKFQLAAASLEQKLPDGILQLGNMLRQGRLGLIQDLGRLGKRPRVRHSKKDAKLVQREHGWGHQAAHRTVVGTQHTNEAWPCRWRRLVAFRPRGSWVHGPAILAMALLAGDVSVRAEPIGRRTMDSRFVPEHFCLSLDRPPGCRPALEYRSTSMSEPKARAANPSGSRERVTPHARRAGTTDACPIDRPPGRTPTGNQDSVTHGDFRHRRR